MAVSTVERTEGYLAAASELMSVARKAVQWDFLRDHLWVHKMADTTAGLMEDWWGMIVVAKMAVS